MSHSNEGPKDNVGPTRSEGALVGQGALRPRVLGHLVERQAAAGTGVEHAAQ